MLRYLLEILQSYYLKFYPKDLANSGRNRFLSRVYSVGLKA